MTVLTMEIYPCSLRSLALKVYFPEVYLPWTLSGMTLSSLFDLIWSTIYKLL